MCCCFFHCRIPHFYIIISAPGRLAVHCLLTFLAFHPSDAVLTRVDQATPNDSMVGYTDRRGRHTDCLLQAIPRRPGTVPTGFPNPPPSSFSFKTGGYCHFNGAALPDFKPSPGCSIIEQSNPKSWLPVSSGGPYRLTFWGDSITRDIFRSLLRFLQETPGFSRVGKDGKDVLDSQGATRKLLTGNRRDPPPLVWNKEIATIAKNPGPCSWLGLAGRIGNVHLHHVRVEKQVLQNREHINALFCDPESVHVINIGVWHNKRKDYINALTYFVRFIKSAVNAGISLPHIVWRETLPQHFASQGGHFVKSNNKRQPTWPCMSNTDIGDGLSLLNSEWRNNIAIKILRENLHGIFGPELQKTVVDVFPAWRLLLHQPIYHYGGKSSTHIDCTHWCSYPGDGLEGLALILFSDIINTYWLLNSTQSSYALSRNNHHNHTLQYAHRLAHKH